MFFKLSFKKNMNKVLYTLEQDRNLDYNSVSYMDMCDVSFYGNEGEVLFFPFSSFEIREIKEIAYNQEKIYEINLLYLGSNVNNIDNKNKKSFDDFQIIKNWDDKSQIDELKKQLDDEKNKNKKLMYENQKLQEKINKLNLEIGKIKLLEDEIKFLKKNLIEKNIEIQKYKTGKYIRPDDSILSIHPGEKIIGVNFVSMGNQDIGHYNIVCKNTDLFVKL